MSLNRQNSTYIKKTGKIHFSNKTVCTMLSCLMEIENNLEISSDLKIEKTSPSDQSIQTELSKFESVEDKLRFCLDSMKASLNGGKAPRFKSFWEYKEACQPLFKEINANPLRPQLWEEYIAISNDARLLKQELNEKSVIAMDQINLALNSLQADLENYQELLNGTLSLQLPFIPYFLDSKKDFYDSHQRELFLLNTLASRVNSLRKEVIKTEMRIRFKNRFFDLLSKLGDQFFPKRKELISNLSQEFTSDIAAFLEQATLSSGSNMNAIYDIRDQIKGLQEFAKYLTLDPPSFSKTRLLLSECWDKLKEQEKGIREQFAEKRLESQKSVQLVREKIQILAQKCQQDNYSVEEASKLSHEISNFMRTVDLSWDDVKQLKLEIQQASDPVFSKIEKEKEERLRQIEESEKQKQEKVETFKREIQTVIQAADTSPVEELVQARDQFAKLIQTLNIPRVKKEEFDHLLKELRNRILEQKEKAFLKLSNDERNSVEQLRSQLKDRMQERHELKAQVESYRKALSRSALDFDKAWRYNQLCDEEKNRLDKVNAMIVDIEEKLSDYSE